MKNVTNSFNYREEAAITKEILDTLDAISFRTKTYSSQIIYNKKRKLRDFEGNKFNSWDPVIKYNFELPWTKLILNFPGKDNELIGELCNKIIEEIEAHILTFCQIEEEEIFILDLEEVEELKKYGGEKRYFTKELKRLNHLLINEGEEKDSYRVLFIPGIQIIEGELDLRFKVQNRIILGYLESHIKTIKTAIKTSIVNYSSLENEF